MSASTSDHWFERRNGGGIRPTCWQGRATLAGYVFLVVIALITYLAVSSQVSLLLLVVVLYTVALAGIILMKSDLKDEIAKRAQDRSKE